jgi:hypothetical protein
VRAFWFHRDPLFLLGCAAYALNRLWLCARTSSPFWHGHFNDLWLIPCALPPLLWAHHRLGWRNDQPPTLSEVTGHLLVWSLLFEGIGPHFIGHATGDWRDVVCYWVGGLLAWVWWNCRRPRLRLVPA